MSFCKSCNELLPTNRSFPDAICGVCMRETVKTIRYLQNGNTNTQFDKIPNEIKKEIENYLIG